MLEGIKLNNYSIVEPIVRADNYQDPLLKVYTEKCPGMSLSKHIAFELRHFDYAFTLSEEDQEKIGMTVYFTKDFRIYHIDLDNNPENGKEFVFYGGGGYRLLYEEFKDFINDTIFEVVDFSECKRKGGYLINGWGSGDENIRDGIINYGGGHYMYSLRYWELEKLFTINVAKWEERWEVNWDEIKCDEIKCDKIKWSEVARKTGNVLWICKFNSNRLN